MSHSPSHARVGPRARIRARLTTLISSERVADTTSVRVWLTRLLSLTLLLGGNALIQAAAMQPAVIDGTLDSRRYSGALDGAVAYALLIAVLMVVSWRSRHDYWRVLVGVVLVIGGAVGALYSIGLVPEPGPTGGMGLRGYLGAYAFSCCVLAGVVSLFAYSGRGLFRPWKVLASGVFAAAGIVGLVAVAELWFPPIVAASNIEAVTTSEPAPEPSEPRLDGGIAWGSAALPGSTSNWYDTAGGLLGTTSHGVKMLDPRTGKLRWSYDRFDVVAIGTPRMSADGTKVAVTSVRSTTSTVLHRASEAQHVWLFDASSGKLLSERLAPSISTSLRAYADGQLIWAVDPAAEGREHGWLGATDPQDGTLAWQLELPRFCGTDSVRPFAETGPALLVAAKCWDSNRDKREGEPPHLFRIDSANGDVSLEWAAPTAGSIEVAAPEAIIDGAVPFQVSTMSEPATTLGALDASGSELWLAEEVDNGLTPPDGAAATLGEDVAAYDHLLRVADGNLVVGSVDGVERDLRLAGVDPRTGKTRWTRELPMDWPSSTGSRVGGLPDGRIVVISRHQPNGEPAGADDRSDGDEPSETHIVITTIDAASGDILERGRTDLTWTRAELFSTQAGLVLRFPAKDDTVLVGLR